ncbi:MAG: hypothetical protein AVO33_04480 [delta proteobacterium ML8_F1]|nr:MAG: hypothetical protein AVO33_04480 [delta proteobacterium ML8_F1]
MPHRKRNQIRPGDSVRIVQKSDQRSGRLTTGIVQKLLTSSSEHPHGIKVRLEDGRVGRVKEIIKGQTPPEE